MIFWLYMLALAVTYGAIITYATKVANQGKRNLCDSCIYLRRKNKGERWTYNCDKFRGFNRCPEYCRDYREREPKEE